jgi:dihydroorotase
MLGLEQALAVVMETMLAPGLIDWPTLAERMSHTPARIGQVASQGRPIAPGEPANLVLVDPTARAEVDRTASLSRSRNNPYHGHTLPDPVVRTIWNGRTTYSRI